MVSSPKEDENDLTEDDLKAIAKEQMDATQETDTEQVVVGGGGGCRHFEN